MRASNPLAPLPHGLFNLEDARIPCLTYTKMSMNTYATCVLGQFTEEDDDGEIAVWLFSACE